ncbi:MAG TPA: hypothetical protein VG944_08640 [Fimbriimonas sp.]|nr:hypothetical protein [Fimbriimonas sp.]
MRHLVSIALVGLLPVFGAAALAKHAPTVTGTWHEVDYRVPASSHSAQRLEKMLKARLKSFRLTLKADKTFSMTDGTGGGSTLGKWHLSNHAVLLDVESFNGMSLAQLKAKVGKDQRTWTMIQRNIHQTAKLGADGKTMSLTHGIGYMTLSKA